MIKNQGLPLSSTALSIYTFFPISDWIGYILTIPGCDNICNILTSAFRALILKSLNSDDLDILRATISEFFIFCALTIYAIPPFDSGRHSITLKFDMS